MRGLACTLTALAAIAAVPGPAAATVRAHGPSPSTGPPPTRAQIRLAVARASRSSYLWATVNICLPKPHQGGVIGIRGEMPALGFRATLSMTIQLGQYISAQQRYVTVTGSTAQHAVTIGLRATGIHQDGAEFPYASETGRLNATVTFTWTRDGRRLAQLTRATTGGHPSAAFGEPPGYSTATCRL